MEQQSMIRTTRLDYKINMMQLQADFKFLFVKIKDMSAFKEYNKLLASWSPQAVTRISGRDTKGDYLIMFRQLPALPNIDGLEFHKILLDDMRDFKIYPNHLLQLLINQQSAHEKSLSEPCKTPELLISGQDWYRQFLDMRQQYYALKLKVNWQQDLDLSIQTFTQVTEFQWDKRIYQYDSERERFQRRYQPSPGIYFVRGNHTSNRNYIDFLSLRDLSSFFRCKVGVAQLVLDNLNLHEGKYLLRPVTFHKSLVEHSSRLKLSKRETIWQQLAGSSLNIYAQVNDRLSQELADQLADHLTRSQLVRKNSIRVVRSQKIQSGFNIQVIRDVRGSAAEDGYEVAKNGQIVQHLTVENFGHYQEGDKEITWKPKVSGKHHDPARDVAIVKLIQELCIKRDLANGKLKTVEPKLASLTQPLEFYYFAFLKKSFDPEVMVIKLAFTPEMALRFSKKKVRLNALTSDDEYTQVCKRVFDSLARPNFQSAWNSVDCVVRTGNKQLLIQRLNRTIMPDGKQIRKQLELNRPDKPLTRSEVVEELKKLRPMVSGDSDYVAAYEQLQALVTSMPPNFPLKDLDEAARKAGLNPKRRDMRQVNQFLTENATFTLKTTLQRELPDSPLAGMKWIGLTRIEEGEGHFNTFYFVGSDKSLKPVVNRAVTLRRLLPLAGDAGIIDELFPKLAAMMSVEFVRSGQYTVVPYPVKYLREYWGSVLRQHPEYR
ncbi:hypothetical protein LACPH_001299 [Lacticaseibacillus parahuelsenbergensis]|uniref:Uncharacterized protein n=1 Tax=Lacticaseibacillus parahuelsenbergensis TaxID=3068305 RepID=A0ABY9L6A7_9LACO|nr:MULTISPECIES: hypothetical protein [Lacticaseibacillus]MDE3282367.1 hypothetical protein [Lacticaseibacillus casei]WLV79252.1 hypothetical protein LACPH_001299 [Lacticaseibacillus sp. NCIMB 15471]